MLNILICKKIILSYLCAYKIQTPILKANVSYGGLKEGTMKIARLWLLRAGGCNLFLVKYFHFSRDSKAFIVRMSDL
jgi:membrane protein DedA with SNARE-associated domain